MKRILLTGCSGFIGTNFLQYVFSHHLPFEVIGVDKNYCSFQHPTFIFLHKSVQELTESDISGCSIILHLAARTGVRQSTAEAEDYLKQNVLATTHLLELAVKTKVQQFFFASSSSVYGDQPGQSETDIPISPLACKSFYALTKQQCEVITHYYSQQFGLQCIGLRFFTVYGPSPRTDMLIGKIIDSAKRSEDVCFFGNPKETFRSFTYVDDVVECILKLIEKESLSSWSVWNIGNSNSVSCQVVLDCLTDTLQQYGLTYSVKYLEKNKLDTIETRANITKASYELNWMPKISIEEGIQQLISAEFSSLENKHSV